MLYTRLRRAAPLLAALGLILAGPILGGTAFASTLQGRVLDPQGKAIAGARVVGRGARAPRCAAKPRPTRRAPSPSPSFRPERTRSTAEAQGFAPRTREALALAVGQSYRLDVALQVAGVRESVEAVSQAALVTAGSSTVDGVIGQSAIDRLPLNGRNFMELAFLVPGNVPTPNFDPTKTNSVVVASAGQLGRGGMVTIDGQENNDDMVGGPLQNVPQDAVQEFQIATNRYSAESGRSGASAINVVTRSGTDAAATAPLPFFLRDESLQALPATYDRTQEAPPFDRQQYALALGGPIKKSEAHWFAAIEYRDQDGAVLVGERDVATRTIRRTFAAASAPGLAGHGPARLEPLRLATASPCATPASTPRTRGRARSTARSAPPPSARTAATSTAPSSARWVKTLSGTTLNTLAASYSRYRNDIVPVAPDTPQLTFPSIQDGASFRVPQATDQDRLQLADSLALVRGAHSLKLGGEVQLIDTALDLGVFQAGRIEMVQDFADFDHNGDGRVDDNDLLFAVTLRSGFPDRNLLLDDCRQHLLRLLRAGRLARHARAHPEPRACAGRWTRTSRTSAAIPTRTRSWRDFYEGDRKRDSDNFGPRDRLQLDEPQRGA